MSKYEPLYRWLSGLKRDQITVSFQDIENTISDTLPRAARSHRAWWENQTENENRPQARAWMNAGFEVNECDLEKQRVTFRRRL